MAIIKRYGRWYSYLRLFKQKLIGIRLDVSTKAEARLTEAAILKACRTGNYSLLDEVERATCIRIFENQQWELPEALGGAKPQAPNDTLTIWRGIELTLKYPEVAASSNRERHEQAFVHVVEHFGKDFPVKSIWIPQIREFQLERSKQGAAGSTVNKERAALSLMFKTLIELGYLDQNPVRMVKAVSENDGRREVYLGFDDFTAIVARLPEWMRPVIQALYYTGGRRNEVLGMEWENVNLKTRIIRLHPHQVKERKPKRLPIHRLLVPIIESARKLRSLSSDRVFLSDTGKPIAEDSLRRPWVAAVKELSLPHVPTIRDLRHVWKSNATRSGIDFEVREAIMGHHRGIAGRYGRISDEELVRAIDSMTFDHGGSEVWVARGEKKKTERKSSGENVNFLLTKPQSLRA